MPSSSMAATASASRSRCAASSEGVDMIRHLGRLIALACRRPWWVLAAALLLTVGALLFTSDRFAMTTDTSALISDTVGWRVNEKKMDAAFPQNGDSVLVVIDGQTPELAERAAAGLAAKMAADPAHFRRVQRP